MPRSAPRLSGRDHLDLVGWREAGDVAGFSQSRRCTVRVSKPVGRTSATQAECAATLAASLLLRRSTARNTPGACQSRGEAEQGEHQSEAAGHDQYGRDRCCAVHVPRLCSGTARLKGPGTRLEACARASAGPSGAMRAGSAWRPAEDQLLLTIGQLTMKPDAANGLPSGAVSSPWSASPWMVFQSVWRVFIPAATAASDQRARCTSHSGL